MGVVLAESIKTVPQGTICYVAECTNQARPGQRSCWSCHAEYRRLRYPSKLMSPEQRAKTNARRYVNVYIERGKMKRGVCEVCESPDTQPHHEDYSKPLQVRWFCRKHHLAHEGKQMHKPTIEKY